MLKWGNKGLTLLLGKCALRKGRNKKCSRRMGGKKSLAQVQNLLLSTYMKDPKISSFRKTIQKASQMNNRGVIIFVAHHMDNVGKICIGDRACTSMPWAFRQVAYFAQQARRALLHLSNHHAAPLRSQSHGGHHVSSNTSDPTEEACLAEFLCYTL